MPLPAPLLQAISAPHGGKVVLILGAGCSAEAPTSLPLSRECSLEAYRRLVNDGILEENDCNDPTDLSLLADVVWEKTGGQAELVERLPKADFLSAMPNEGYLLALALMREQAVLAIVTLNFDLAASHALAAVGGIEVNVLNGPQAGLAGITNLIYLHRNATSPNGEWILRTADLGVAWQGQWEELIAQRVMAASVTVFAGLGSPAGVLISSVRRIRASNVQSIAYVVGRGPVGASRFIELLGLPQEAYIQSTWGAFMTELSDRCVEEHRARLVTACEQLSEINQWEREDVVDLSRRIAYLGLLEIGRLRAMWFFTQGSYLPLRYLDVQLWADLVLSIALVERVVGLPGRFVDGLLEFRVQNRIVGLFALASGRGTKRWLALETDLHRQARVWSRKGHAPSFAIVTGAIGSGGNIAAPVDLVNEYSDDDILNGGDDIQMINADDLRGNPDRIRRMVRNA